MRRFSLTLCLLLAVGCAGIPLPKAITQGDITPLRKKRTDEFTRQFDGQRDFAEYEAAKARWVQQRDPKGCREALEKLLTRKPEHREGRLLMAELLLAEEDPEAAYKHAKTALDAHPNDAQTQYTVALTLDALGKTTDALGYYERATKMDPRNEAFTAAYQTARDAVREEARLSKSSSLSIPDSFDDLAAEGLPAGYSAPSAPSAPLPPSAGRADSAGFASVTDSAAKSDNPQIPISAAAAALRANRPDLAVELLTPAAKQFPTSVAIHRMLGAACYRTGDYKSSQVALQQALSLDKSCALSYLLMGCTLAKLGQNEAAEAHFRQARTLDPRYKAIR